MQPFSSMPCVLCRVALSSHVPVGELPWPLPAGSSACSSPSSCCCSTPGGDAVFIWEGGLAVLDRRSCQQQSVHVYCSEALQTVSDWLGSLFIPPGHVTAACCPVHAAHAHPSPPHPTHCSCLPTAATWPWACGTRCLTPETKRRKLRWGCRSEECRAVFESRGRKIVVAAKPRMLPAPHVWHPPCQRALCCWNFITSFKSPFRRTTNRLRTSRSHVFC